MLPTALLETRGARTGRVRRNAVIYFHDGDRVTVVASKLGLPEHPGWFHNLRADPDVRFGGQPFRANRPGGARQPALLESAARNLSRYGYGNLVLEQVAREAGYTRGALYHQFQDKEDLALAVIE